MASDMHIHTAFSDGNFMPEEILRQAREAGLDYIAITDHDTIDGIRYMYERGFYPSKGIGIIPGIEFSSNRLGHEVHILGYNINIFNQQLIDALNEVAEARWVRFSTMLEKIKSMLSWNSVGRGRTDCRVYHYFACITSCTVYACTFKLCCRGDDLCGS